MRRREFLSTIMASTAVGMGHRYSWAGESRDVAWLKDVASPPQTIPIPNAPLAPLLVNPGQQTITTVKRWESVRPRLKQEWLKFLGPMPVERPAVQLEVLKEDRPEGCIRTLVRYLAETDEPVEGYLLRPEKKSEVLRSGIVAMHPTTQTSIEETAGLTGRETHHTGLQLCRDGHVVFCPRCYLWQTPGYKLDVKSTVESFHKRHPDTLGMHKMLYDAQRAVDVLVSLPDVDPHRIGAVGHSLGAKEALYLAAFDERIKATVSSEGGIGFTSTNWKDPWYLGAGIEAPDFKLNHHQVLALIAPRPFLVLGGEMGPGAADGDRSWPYLAAAQSVYRLYGEPVRLGLLNHHQGHSIPLDVRAKMLEWLRTYLA